jgi:mannitol 2-dehydrogenase
VGGFHRAHLAIYCHQLAERGGDWGIRGIGLLAGDAPMATALEAQDHLYTFTQKGTGRASSEVVGSIIDYRLAVADPQQAIGAIADPVTAIVSLTVTEAGYGDDAGNRRTFDILATGLDLRRLDGLAPITVLSCDNLPGNGDAARVSVVAAAQRISPDCAAWVAEHCTFPNSMVDRITPTTSDADREHLTTQYGMTDRWPVVAEPFWQWVLEDRFAAGRPAFDDVGVLFTDDVHAWELYKLRLLNAGHSAIAYLSALAGITFVDEAMAEPHIRAFLSSLLLDEAAPTLTPIPGYPREDYVATVLERFANTGVRDQIARLCIDGTSKFPTFLIPTIRSQVAVGGPIALAALALAGWAHYLADVPEAAQARDDRGDASRARARAARVEPGAFLTDNDIVPGEVATDPTFSAAFERAHRLITDVGPIAALAAIVADAD